MISCSCSCSFSFLRLLGHRVLREEELQPITAANIYRYKWPGEAYKARKSCIMAKTYKYAHAYLCGFEAHTGARIYIHTCIILRVACPTRCHHPLSLHHGSTILCVHCASAPKMQQMPHKCPSPMCTIDSSGGWGGASGKWALGGGWLH